MKIEERWQRNDPIMTVQVRILYRCESVLFNLFQPRGSANPAANLKSKKLINSPHDRLQIFDDFLVSNSQAEFTRGSAWRNDHRPLCLRCEGRSLALHGYHTTFCRKPPVPSITDESQPLAMLRVVLTEYEAENLGRIDKIQRPASTWRINLNWADMRVDRCDLYWEWWLCRVFAWHICVNVLRSHQRHAVEVCGVFEVARYCD